MERKYKFGYGYITVSLVLGIMIGFVIGALFYTALSQQAKAAYDEAMAKEYAGVNYGSYTSFELTDGHEIILETVPNAQKVNLYLPVDVAPNFFVGNGMIGGSYEMYLDNDPEEWDPKNIGVDGALDLIGVIQQEIPEATEAYARQTEIGITLGMDFVSRRGEIIDSIIESICNYYEWELK